MAENTRPVSTNNNANNNNNPFDFRNIDNNANASPASPVPMKRIDFAAMRRAKSPMMAAREQNMASSHDIDMDGGRRELREKGRAAVEHQESLAVHVDTQRMQLISPPPEEMLTLTRRLSGARPSAQSTPSFSGEATGVTPAKSVSKRKRAPPTPAKASTSSSVSGTTDDARPQPLTEATPNPKPRKQRHVRMQSVGSPTLGPGKDAGQEKELQTTPTKSKKATTLKSPHARNPDADYIPPMVLNNEDVEEMAVGPPTNPNLKRVLMGARTSRRSATPIPPYEPPTDVFTPPKEVFLSPAQPKSVSKSSKRKATGVRGSAKGKGLKVNTNLANVQVKQEIPDDIDLRAPMPPASPTDDPLLLSGPPEPVRDEERSSTPVRQRRRSVSVQVQTEEEEDTRMRSARSPETDYDDVLPPSSPDLPLDTDEAEAVDRFDWERQEGQPMDQSTEDSMMQLDDPQDADVEPVRLFDLDPVDAAGGWSDSDDDDGSKEDEEGEGEYTGKWTMTKIRTKQDPPSSATRSRQELWGRPISPFPKMKKLVEDDVAEEEEVRRMSVEPEEDQLQEEVELPDQEVTLPDTDTHMDLPQIEADEDNDSSDTDDEPGLVKITSADPRAAARAVAILKQHDYDCYTKLIKKRRSSHSAADDLAKESRRRDVSNAGVSKSSIKRRRRSTMGVLGDRVIIPGTPITTLPELLHQAEKDVVRETSSAWSLATTLEGRGERDPFRTPLTDRFQDNIGRNSFTTPNHYPAGERDWAKDDWKLLDACFTDQRLELTGLQDGSMAPVERVALDDVVSRFTNLMGGQSLLDTFGESWTRNNLFERTRALQRKQQSGNIAPPTTPHTPFSFTSPSNIRASPGPSISATQKRGPMTTVPDFTPLARGRAPPPPRKSSSRPVLPPPVFANAPFESLPSEKERSRKKLPASLLAPRYSHLLEEAVAVSHEEAFSQSQYGDEEEERPAVSAGTSIDESSTCQDFFEGDASQEVAGTAHVWTGADESFQTAKEPSSTLGSRVRGFFTSYLPILSNPPPSQLPRSRSALQSAHPGLPLPPRSVLEKPRGPVTTPARLPLPRAPHPKDIVHLNPAPLLASNLPRPKVAPKRLVELMPVPVLPPKVNDDLVALGGLVPRPRRSSGSSVKDLVKGFEKMDEMASKASGSGGMKKAGSSSDLRKAWRQDQPDTRPKWKP